MIWTIDQYINLLIDDLDNRSREYARKLKAAGIHRFVVLTGGEEALKRRGQSEKVTVERFVPETGVNR